MKSSLFLMILLFFFTSVFAQIYPVQVTVVPTPPHRNYLNSFSEQGALNVYLTLTDFNSGPVAVKLSMKLNGPGYEFRSLPNNLVYVLNPGEPKQVPVEDLAVFFSSAGQTLNFNQSKLPEGNSSICVDVYKNQTGELLSNNGCGYFYMGYGQPAQLLQPTCNTTITIPEGFPATTDLNQTPLQFNFSPALAPIGLQNEVENTLYIYNWLGTVNTNPPLQPTGLSLAMDPIPLGPITSYTLLPIDNQLIVGQEYVWYVQSTLSGSTNQFQNTGWTAPCKFKYGTTQSIEATLAEGLSVEWVDLVSQSETKGQATWQVVKEDPNSSATFNQFILSYRKVVPEGEDPYEWFADTVNDVSKAIYQLEPETTYEAYVEGKLGSFISEPTATRTFTTGPPRTYACGVSNFGTKATAFQPLEYADPGMKVKIGMFQLEFVDVENTGQPGHFSGTGLIPIDFLFGMEARVEFDDLKIDKEYDVWEGTANVLTDGLDAWLQDQYQQFQDPIYVNGTIDSAYVSDSLAHVVINGIDTTFAFPCATCPVILNDVAGNQVTIYPNGTVVWGSYLDVSEEQLDVPDSEIALFEEHQDERGGFDGFVHMEWNANYEIIRTTNAVNYFVANKSVIQGQTDKVKVRVPANEYNETAVKLTWQGLSTPLNPTSSLVDGNDRVFEFDLPVIEEETISIYAVSDSLKIGKLNVVNYEAIDKNIVVIPLAGSVNQVQLATYLNGTLGEAGINFNVTISDTIGVSQFSTTQIKVPDATLMTKYGAEMRAVRNAYFESHETEDDTYYLFVVNDITDTVNNQSVDGYMVRGKSVGFIKASTAFRTIAHELGHGIGGLEHSWKNNGPVQGTTDNLMDYSQNNQLIKQQWVDIREGENGGIWDEAEDNQNSVSLSINDLIPLKNGNKYYFITPERKYVALSDSIQTVRLSLLDRFYIFPSSNESEFSAPIGTLTSFTDSEGKYVKYRVNKGYIYDETEEPYLKDIRTSEVNDFQVEGAIVSYVRFSGGDLKPIFFKAKMTQEVPNLLLKDDVLGFDMGQEVMTVEENSSFPFENELPSYGSYSSFSQTSMNTIVYPQNPLLGTCPNKTIVSPENLKIFYQHEEVPIVFRYTQGLPENYNSLINTNIKFSDLTIQNFYGNTSIDFNVYEVLQYLTFKNIKYNEASEFADCVNKIGNDLLFEFKHLFREVSTTQVPNTEAIEFNKQKFNFNPGYDANIPKRALNSYEITAKFKQIGEHSLIDVINEARSMSFDQATFDLYYNQVFSSPADETGDVTGLNALYANFLVPLANCKYSGIPWTQRHKLMKLIVTLDNSHWQENGQEIFYKLCRYVPEADENLLIEAFYANDHVTWLYEKLWQNMDNNSFDPNDFNTGSKILSHISSLIHKKDLYNRQSALTSKIQVTPKDVDHLPNELKTELNSGLERNLIQICLGYAAPNATYNVGVKPTNMQKAFYLPAFANIKNKEGSPIVLAGDNKFYINQSYTLITKEYKADGSLKNSSEVYRLEEGTIYSLNPNDLIEVVILETIVKLDLKKGDAKMMSVADAFLLQKNIEESKQNQHSQIIIDIAVIGAAIIAAPFTAGTSLGMALTVMPILTSGIDIYYQNTLNNITPNEYKKHWFYSNWETVKMYCDITEGAMTLGVGFLKPTFILNGKVILNQGSVFKLGIFKHQLKYMKDFAATVSESAAIKTIKDNIYKFVKLGTALPVNPNSIAITKLDNILAKSGFSGAGGIFSKLPKNTPLRQARYSSLQSFRDEFIKLYGQTNSGVKSLDEVLDDFDNLIVKHSSVPNIEQYVDELMEQQSKFKGGTFGLEILNNLPTSLQGKTLIKFEASIDDISECRFDLLFEDGNQLKVFVETKNYAQSTSFSSSFYNQFKTYISNPAVTNIDEIKYFFRANAGISKTERVQKFKNLINSGGVIFP